MRVPKTEGLPVLVNTGNYLKVHVLNLVIFKKSSGGGLRRTKRVFTIVMWDSQMSQTNLTLLEQMLSLVVHNLTFHIILNLYLFQIRKDIARRPCSTLRYSQSTDLQYILAPRL